MRKHPDIISCHCGVLRPEMGGRGMRRWATVCLLAELTLLAVGCLLTAEAEAQEKFSQLTGPLTARPVREQATIELPYITWGGDVATFMANGGPTTVGNSIFGQHKLNFKLVAGDNFVEQVKRYVQGETPFLRGTMRMLGQASEVLGANADTKPVVILQLSWSAGDHIVAREGIKTLNDLASQGRKVRIACQQGGPHVGLLYDSLETVKLTRDQIEIVWVADLTGPRGPAEKFRTDPKIDACCVITPDLIGLTGGIDSVGSGAEGTVKGAHMINSTQSMARSIADVYAVRADWYATHREQVDRFVGGYLKAAAEVVRLRDDFEKSQRMSAPYRQVLTMAQKILGEEVLPTLEVDAHGLLLDCNFVPLPGQIAFFQDAGNPSGFAGKMKDALDMAEQWGYAGARRTFAASGLDYKQVASKAEIPYSTPAPMAELGGEGGFPNIDEDDLDPNTIASFTIRFQPNQHTFSAEEYGAEFARAIKSASTFGNAAIVIRGHADPSQTLINLVRAGMANGLIRRSGASPNYTYYLDGKPLDLTATDKIVELITTGRFETGELRPRQTMQAALNLSLARATAVRDAIASYARDQGVNLNIEQLKPLGAGISDPLIKKPRSIEEAKQNMRVEFRIVRVKSEATDGFDF